MLAQSFKPADELGITEPQKSALMKTPVLLETGKLVHVTGMNEWFPNRGEAFEGQFNMNQWNVSVPGCGTIACIGGTAELVGGVQFLHGDLEYRSALYDLFMPSSINENAWDLITPAQAATALRSYLTTGDAKWHEAVSPDASKKAKLEAYSQHPHATKAG